ncbi:efflux RND transporter periplasmic adaptor subunit [Aestuariibacter salexigens]|uniref:efflux RND transporter periplasmic adaptor subunit n=1 Tax=Aestuariibacter salexigens TaxID=226010 RepID=UPI000415EDB0|nr:efflux RND transporter periplasmic adaptor subunit [Aestuariibacter salexigens]
MWKNAVTLIFLLITTPLLAQSWGGNSRPALVLVEPIVFEYEENNIEAVGTAEAVRSVILFPAAADRVTAVNFEPGQMVEKGDVLVELDARRQKVAVERAEISLADAERNVRRLLESQQQGAVAQSDLDDAKTVRDLAKVALDEARADLEDRQVVAPFSGVMGLTDVEVGDRINLQTAITTIDARDELFVNFRAPEAALNVLLNNPDVTLQPWSNRTLELDAKIAEVDSRINEQDRTLRARAVLDNSDDRYRPGMSFRVSLKVRGNRYAAIPEAAMSWGAGGAYVWKAEDGKAVRIPVEIKQRLRGRILVSGDLQEGESLISEGVQRLREGQAVSAQETSVARANAIEGVAG